MEARVGRGKRFPAAQRQATTSWGLRQSPDPKLHRQFLASLSCRKSFGPRKRKRVIRSYFIARKAYCCFAATSFEVIQSVSLLNINSPRSSIPLQLGSSKSLAGKPQASSFLGGSSAKGLESAVVQINRVRLSVGLRSDLSISACSRRGAIAPRRWCDLIL